MPLSTDESTTVNVYSLLVQAIVLGRLLRVRADLAQSAYVPAAIDEQQLRAANHIEAGTWTVALRSGPPPPPRLQLHVEEGADQPVPRQPMHHLRARGKAPALAEDATDLTWTRAIVSAYAPSEGLQRFVKKPAWWALGNIWRWEDRDRKRRADPARLADGDDYIDPLDRVAAQWAVEDSALLREELRAVLTEMAQIPGLIDEVYADNSDARVILHERYKQLERWLGGEAAPREWADVVEAALKNHEVMVLEPAARQYQRRAVARDGKRRFLAHSDVEGITQDEALVTYKADSRLRKEWERRSPLRALQLFERDLVAVDELIVETLEGTDEVDAPDLEAIAEALLDEFGVELAPEEVSLLLEGYDDEEPD